MPIIEEFQFVCGCSLPAKVVTLEREFSFHKGPIRKVTCTCGRTATGETIQEIIRNWTKDNP